MRNLLTEVATNRVEIDESVLGNTAYQAAADRLDEMLRSGAAYVPAPGSPFASTEQLVDAVRFRHGGRSRRPRVGGRQGDERHLRERDRRMWRCSCPHCDHEAGREARGGGHDGHEPPARWSFWSAPSP